MGSSPIRATRKVSDKLLSETFLIKIQQTKTMKENTTKTAIDKFLEKNKLESLEGLYALIKVSSMICQMYIERAIYLPETDEWSIKVSTVDPIYNYLDSVPGYDYMDDIAPAINFIYEVIKKKEKDIIKFLYKSHVSVTETLNIKSFHFIYPCKVERDPFRKEELSFSTNALIASTEEITEFCKEEAIYALKILPFKVNLNNRVEDVIKHYNKETGNNLLFKTDAFEDAISDKFRYDSLKERFKYTNGVSFKRENGTTVLCIDKKTALDFCAKYIQDNYVLKPDALKYKEEDTNNSTFYFEVENF